jgi:hypothetical protein
MIEHKVYELIDQTGTIVDIGYTASTLKLRLRGHVKPTGRWPGRRDLIIRTYSIHLTKQEALKAEGARKLQLGMEWTEMIWGKVGSALGGQSNARSGHIQRIGQESMAQQLVCPHCSKHGKGVIMFRYHFDRCKLKTAKLKQA